MQVRGVLPIVVEQRLPPSEKQRVGHGQACRVNSVREAVSICGRKKKKKKKGTRGYAKKKLPRLRPFQQITLPRLHGILVRPSGQQGKSHLQWQGEEGEEEAHAISWQVSSLCKTNSYLTSGSLLVSQPQCSAGQGGSHPR